MPVGFFILHTGKAVADFYADWAGAALLRAFLVDHVSQGQGFAKAGLALLPDFVRRQLPDVREIVLAVNERNAAAELYLRAGFRDCGLRRMGKKGQLLILQYCLDRPLSGISGYMDVEETLRLRMISSFTRSALLMELFSKSRELMPHPYYIGAGCLVQTVWNELTGRAQDYGISDIDIVYYDNGDLSVAAEERMSMQVREKFADLPLPLDVKNQARVHLWYEAKFGIPLAPYASLEHAIASWPTTVTSLGARLTGAGEWQIYAPFGLSDLFALMLRPNKALVTEEIYRSKTQKWQQKWPELRPASWS